jgi:sigma-54-specific transcriptional regulator
VRLIAATNINLEEAVEAGRFRTDLYYRLNVAALRLLPLRERPGDILPLAHHFLSEYSSRLGCAVAAFAPETLQQLESYPWPGNIVLLNHLWQPPFMLRLHPPGYAQHERAPNRSP